MSFRLNPITGMLDLVTTPGTGGAVTSVNGQTGAVIIPIEQVDRFTLNGTDVTNGFVTLTFTPIPTTGVILLVEDAGNMFYNTDYTVFGNQLNWASLALNGILSSGDNLTVLYNH